MQRGHYDVEQRHKTAIKQLQYRYKKNFGRCNNLTMRLWANSGSSPVRTAKALIPYRIGAFLLPVQQSSYHLFTGEVHRLNP